MKQNLGSGFAESSTRPANSTYWMVSLPKAVRRMQHCAAAARISKMSSTASGPNARYKTVISVPQTQLPFVNCSGLAKVLNSFPEKEEEWPCNHVDLEPHVPELESIRQTALEVPFNNSLTSLGILCMQAVVHMPL